MIALGVLLWTQPQHHAPLGVALVLTALASFLYTNLGGFLLGMPAAGVAAVG
ncbi:hypothetical protein SAMN05216266_1424 [Amycolatopsis marina]|uniref:Uncharacterized protein n=2 Tax=Amycolatopsis TaxID=1813 RepID=A0A1I1CTR0_9PSEU|nr:hypothetical protein [Amycolatopsis roodepoortensis]TWE15007.1 hypothetical protein FHX69_7181 [Prauserella muralis]SDU62731.1 hypothetical protein SAMN04489733_7268 [Amycolatopsis keratiniphila]SFB64278.1 hypothetical protein SAMN05216266_1424 [Amycolatopsis marina]